jgi:hypothetical protein
VCERLKKSPIKNKKKRKRKIRIKIEKSVKLNKKQTLVCFGYDLSII